MKIVLFSIISYFMLMTNLASNKANPNAVPHLPSVSLTEECKNFNILNNKIRDAQISKKEALQQFQLLLSKIKLDFYSKDGKDFPESSWCFPVQNYDFKAIGGTNGNGYIPLKYSYFDGNNHLGHPAHDIFIQDKNQDCIDDLSNKPVNILSMSGGVVIATDSIWNVKNSLRGGKYILIYDPFSNSIFYYAHNNKIVVGPGDIIKPGDKIAIMGRTGVNANKQRSPTHLHIMQLKLDNNNSPTPHDCYNSLIKAKVTG